MKTSKINLILLSAIITLLVTSSCSTERETRTRFDFNESWRFHLGDIPDAHQVSCNDSDWRILNLPHDWSIEGKFDKDHKATPGGGALPGGIGWYRKHFFINEKDTVKNIFIDFDGVYMNSEVWINGNYLGKRPNGYISFRYDLTPYLEMEKENVIAVKVDNSAQPNSRWYSGSGIYRNVWLIKTGQTYVDQWGTFITTPNITKDEATVQIKASIASNTFVKRITVRNTIVNADSKVVTKEDTTFSSNLKDINIEAVLKVSDPKLWSLDDPYLYKCITEILVDEKSVDSYETTFGIRSFYFDSKKGFFLNDKPVKIKGVCNHHDLGCLGSAINTRALERQLEILREMGCNAIRTSHNPPAPELLDLCDKMGFLVMDEAFDMWKKGKTPFDYHLYWDQWHKTDLIDFIKRDRNHPSIIIWSIGNEILEQWDDSGIQMVQDLYNIVREYDTSRPITTANNPPSQHNALNKPGILDLVGYNYAHEQYIKFPEIYPGKKFIATETNSALATRGHYDMPSDEIRRWPIAWDIPFTEGNPDNTVSAYDHVSAPWGSTHEETWKIIKKYDYLPGMFVWTGFDYLGEPTPYSWPSRSSYFGIIDLAGFPKDSYYMYQSEWTSKPVLHIFPHWNWEEGKEVDIWAYTNYDEVELFLNDKSLGTKSKEKDELHVMWRIKYEPGTLKAVARKKNEREIIKTITTAKEPVNIEIIADRKTISADGKDLCFVTIRITDNDGNLVPDAENLVTMNISGPGKIIGTDNGNPVSHEPFKTNYRKAFHGLCLFVIQSTKDKGEIHLTVTSENLKDNSEIIQAF